MGECGSTWGFLCTGGGGTVNFVREISHFKLAAKFTARNPGGFCEISRTPAADAVHSGGGAVQDLYRFQRFSVDFRSVPVSPVLHLSCPAHQSISGSVREIYHTKSRGFREISRSEIEIYHREID